MTPAEKWVEGAVARTRPDRVVWCDGSDAENARFTEQMLSDGTLLSLNADLAPGCTLHRSHPSDVARTEHLTFIASRSREDAGPTNNWMSPDEARAKVGPLFDGVMRGRTMYVVPYVMGPLGSPFSKVGIEVTDSLYVVANMRIMTRMGRAALDQLGASEDFVPGLHSTGDLSPDRRFIVHFPEERLIWSVGLGLRRERAAREEVLRPPHRQRHGTRPGMACRAHADPRAHAAGRRGALHRGGVSIGVRQDEPVHAGRAAGAARLQGPHPRRRHRLAAAGPRRPALGRESRGGLLRRRARHRARHEPERPGHDQPRHDLHQRRRNRRRGPVVGREDEVAPRRPDRLAGASVGRNRSSGAPELALHDARASVSEHVVPLGRPTGRSPLRHTWWAAAERGWRRSCSRPSTGITGSSRRRPWDPRRPRPRRARWASCAGTRWRCFPSAATTWGTTSATGSRWDAP